MTLDEAGVEPSLRQQAQAVMDTGVGRDLLGPMAHGEGLAPRFIPSLRARGWNVHHAAATPVADPFNLGLFRRALGVAPGDDSRWSGRRTVPAVNSGLPTNRLQDFGEALTLLRRLRLINNPTVIWLDSIQFADPGSVAMIKRTRPCLPTLPLLLVVTWQFGVTPMVDTLRAELS